jgi:hypothetical protein
MEQRWPSIKEGPKPELLDMKGKLFEKILLTRILYEVGEH